MNSPRTPRHVILTGYMGVGKTTVGRLLAERLGRPFIDLDAEVERRAGRSIAEIFATEGEAAFRRLEAAALSDLLAAPPAVIATGGGALLTPAARRSARAAGTVVCLTATPDEIRSRFPSEAQASRPLWGSDAEAFRRRLAERAGAYARAAHVFIDAGRDRPEAIAHTLADLLADPARRRRRTVRVASAAGSYPVVVGRTLLPEVGLRAAALLPGRRALIIADANVAALHLEPVRRAFLAAGFEVAHAVIPPGETSKTLGKAERLYDAAVEAGLDRRSLIVALGGGVVGDLAGFVAATYMRGVPLIQVPTSLLAQIDASVGGKTGVNHPRGKNLIGAFWPPSAVFCDLDVLGTLPVREWRAGLAEAVKHGILGDGRYFRWLEAHADRLAAADPDLRETLVHRSIRIKAAVVAADEREGGLRAVLNLGHTVGHAVEAALGYRDWLHGEAVAVGLVAAARLAVHLGLLPAGDAGRIERLLARLGLPTRLPPRLAPEAVLAAASTDKKRVGDRLRWILPSGIGRVVIRDDVPADLVLSVLQELAPPAP